MLDVLVSLPLFLLYEVKEFTLNHPASVAKMPRDLHRLQALELASHKVLKARVHATVGGRDLLPYLQPGLVAGEDEGGDSRDAVEHVKLRVGQLASVLNHDAHERVVDHDEPPRGLREGPEERFRGLAEADGGLVGGDEVSGESGVAGERGREIRCREVVEDNVRVIRVCGAGLDLGVVEGRADVVDLDVVGGDDVGELQELVEMALEWEWHHYYSN